MNHQLNKRLSCFAIATPDWFNPTWVDALETSYTCSFCREITTFKNPTLYAAYKARRFVKCKKCAAPEGFHRDRCPPGVIECRHCILRYWDQGLNGSSPFNCLHTLKHKQKLWGLAYEIVKGNPDVIFQRNQQPFPNNPRKVELKAINPLTGDVLWIDTLPKITPEDLAFSLLFTGSDRYLPVTRKELEAPTVFYRNADIRL